MIIAIDTETVGTEQAPWSVQWCTSAGEGKMCTVDNTDALNTVRGLLEHPENLTVVHNAPFDLTVLRQLGIHPSRTHDAMIMGYLLGCDSLSLKDMALRYCGIHMRKYKDVVADAAKRNALHYLEQVLAREWPDPEPVLQRKADGSLHAKFPQNIRRKVQRLLVDYERDPELDVRERWKRMDGREAIEAELGQMPFGYLTDVETSVAVEYACKDADATYQLYTALTGLMDEYSLWDILEIDMGAVPIILDMMETGAYISPEHFHGLVDVFERRQYRIEDELEAIAGRYVNPNSSQQVAQILYEQGIVDSPDVSTDADTLDRLRSHEAVRKIQEYRHLNKLIGTYARPLPQLADENNRVHTDYRIDVTTTGRLSSRNPNLQNIPVRTSDGKRIREGFIAPPGCVLLCVDFSQVELRVAAHVSGDERMIQLYNEGGDIHEATRYSMFGGPPDDTQRKYAKVVNFATLYSVTPPGLLNAMYDAGITDMDEHDCARFIDAFYSTYRGYGEWVGHTKAKARRDGYTRDMFGRICWAPELESSVRRTREDGYRRVLNFPIQSGAGGILKQAMIELTPFYREMNNEGITVRPILQVHDELVFEVAEDALIPVADTIKSVMAHAVSLSVPLSVDAEYGYNWKQLMEL